MAPFARRLFQTQISPHAHSLVLIIGRATFKKPAGFAPQNGGIREQRLPSSLRLCLQGGH
jgi:hypothetical protein